MWMLTTDLDQRSRTFYITPRNGVISHRARIGGNSSCCQPHTQKQTQNKMRPWSLHAVCHFTHVYFCAQTAADVGDIGTWQITIILINEKNKQTNKQTPQQTNKQTNTPNWSSLPGGNWLWFLNLQCESVMHLQCADIPKLWKKKHSLVLTNGMSLYYMSICITT